MDQNANEASRVNKFSLELLTNPLYQKCIMKTEKEQVKPCKADLKFYRKRILALTGDYIKGKYDQHGTSNEALKQLHLEYVYNVIQYFKMTDTIDIIQNEHIQNEHNIPAIEPDTSVHNTVLINATPSHGNSPSSIPECDFSSSPILPEPCYNSQLRVKQINTLDSYIKRTKKVVNSPIKLPVNRVIDYHVPELKNKGVKENNINIGICVQQKNN